MTTPTTDHDARFDGVVALLHEQLARDPQPHGAAVCAYVEGRCVLDAWAGEAAPGRPWERDTRAIVWSLTKGLTAAALLALYDRGEIDVDAPVSTYWPEFGAEDKDEILVADVLSHTSRLPWWEGFEEVARLEEAWGWDRPREIAASIAAAAPTLGPYEGAYHSLTYGWMLDEILVRALDRDAREVFAQDLGPLMGASLRLGSADHDDPLRAHLVLAQDRSDPVVRAIVEERQPGTPAGSTLLVTTSEGAALAADVANHPRFSVAPQPACNAQVDARSVARVYGVLGDGGRRDGARLISRPSIERFSAPVWSEDDAVTGTPATFALGFAVSSGHEQLGRFVDGPTAFGHAGWGGSAGFAVPEAGLGFGFVTNRLDLCGEAVYARELADAVLDALR